MIITFPFLFVGWLVVVCLGFLQAGAVEALPGLQRVRPDTLFVPGTWYIVLSPTKKRKQLYETTALKPISA